MISKEARQTLNIAWPLLASIVMIMMGVGLQGTLLSLRANMEGFPIFATGLIMAAYYFGYLIGCTSATKLIGSVGHIRVFAACASMASTTILFHGVFVDPWAWWAIRFLGGISFAGLFVVAESWLNSITPNKLRGQIFTFYIFVVHGGLFMGQFFIGIGNIGSIGLFVLISVLVSLSLLPVTLADKPAPGYKEPEVLPFRDIIKLSPLASLGVFCAGMSGATFMTLGPIYAHNIGLSNNEIAFYVGSFILGAGTIPLIVGWISDRFDRRKIIVKIALAGCITSFFIASSPVLWAFSIFVLGGTVTSLYSVCIAFINDRIKPEQITSASASLIMINGIGAAVGPIIAGFLMQKFDGSLLFYMQAVAFGLTFFLGIYRVITGKAINIAKQRVFRPIPVRSGIAVMRLRKKKKKMTLTAGD